MSWPKPGGIPFQSKGDDNLKAMIDWIGLYDEESFARGFKAAADLVVNAVPGATGEDFPFFPDQYFFPVAYLYRHCLELQLKALLRTGFGLVSVNDDLLGSHNLHQLWNKARELLEVRWSGAPKDPLDAAEQVILNFHRLDGSGQEFRYPRAKEGKKSLSKAPPVVSLDNLKDVVNGVYDFLSGCVAGLEQ
jgi:hypothetical protein